TLARMRRSCMSWDGPGGTSAASDRPVRRRLPVGAEVIEEGVHARVWAPACRTVTLVLERAELPMRGEPDGYFSLFVPRLPPGTRYRFRLDNETDLAADPASRCQPDGPFGPSEVIDPTFDWTDRDWRGVTEPQQQVL